MYTTGNTHFVTYKGRVYMYIRKITKIWLIFDPLYEKLTKILVPLTGVI